MDARTGHQIPYSRSYRGYELPDVGAAGKGTLVTAESSLRTLGCCVVQAELGLLRLLLTQSPKCWNYMNTHHQAQQNSDFLHLFIYLYESYMCVFVRGGFIYMPQCGLWMLAYTCHSVVYRGQKTMCRNWF